MNLTTQVKAQELGSWRCEVFAIGGKCIAWAITPPNWQITKRQAKRFASKIAVVCKNMPPGEYDIIASGQDPVFTQDVEWVNKLGGAVIPDGEVTRARARHAAETER